MSERSAGGETESFFVTLQQKNFLRAVVTSSDLDTVFTLYGPDQKKLLTVDLLKYPSPEPISFEAEKAGEYKLEIRADAPPVVHGRFALITDVTTQAQETDRQRLIAERLLIQANDLELEASPESLQKAIDKRGEALVLWRTMGDRYWEAYSLHYSGRALSRINKNQEALTAYDQALGIRRAIGDRFGESATLSNSGQIYADLKQNEMARQRLHQAVAVSNAIGNIAIEARALASLAILLDGMGDKKNAIACFERARPLWAAMGDKDGEANTLVSLGVAFADRGDNLKAVEVYSQALPLWRALGDKNSEAGTLVNLGNVHIAMGEKQKFLERYTQVLTLRRSMGDKRGEANTLYDLADGYSSFGESRKALETRNEALTLYREIDDKVGESDTQSSIASEYFSLGETLKAISAWNQALTIARAVNDKDREANILANLGVGHSDLGEKLKALEYYDQALPLKRLVGDKAGEAKILNNIGNAYAALDDRLKALEFYHQALALKRSGADRRGEADTLVDVGIAHITLEEKQKALEYFNQALPIYQALGAKHGEASAFHNIATAYSDFDEHKKAIEFFNKALLIVQNTGNKKGETNTIRGLAATYFVLGDTQKAAAYYNRALLLARQIGYKISEAQALDGIGVLHSSRGENQRALEYYNQALTLHRMRGNKSGEATALSHLGVAYADLGNNQKALECYTQSLALSREAKDMQSEANALGNLANTHYVLGENQRALDSLNQALPLWRAINIKGGEANVFNNVSVLWKTLGKPKLAIFYGKEAINSFQQLRGRIQNLDKETQRTYLKTIEKVYKELAGILIAQRRLEEATQVINLLRDQEFFDFDRNATSPPGETVLTARESGVLSDFQRELEIVADARKKLTLRSLPGYRQPTQTESAELERLKTEFEKTTDVFRTTLKNIETEFSQADSAKDKVERVPDIKEMQAGLRELSLSTGQTAAALYTLVGDDKFHLILIQPDGELRSFESQIKSAELNKMNLQFYALIQSPTYDPRPLGKELYDVIFKPVEAELLKAGIQTLMWQLDGNLRYLPMAALFDGKKYLVERFQNVVFTRANRERMTRKVTQSWTEIKAIALIRSAIVEKTAARYSEALNKYNEAEPLVRAINDHALKGTFHNGLATLLNCRGVAEKREDYIDRALIEFAAASFHFEQAGNDRYLARVENNLGFLYYTIGQYRDAHKHLDRARHLFLKLKDVGTVAQVDDTRARTLIAEGHLVEAERVVRAAVRTLQRGGEQALLAETLTTYGTAVARLGNCDRAAEIFHQAIKVAETAGDLEATGRTRLSIIEELGDKLSIKELISIYRQAIDVLKSSQDPMTGNRSMSCSARLLDVIERLEPKQGPPETTWEGFSLREHVRTGERAVIERALRDSGGSVTRASRLLGFKHHQPLISLISSRHQDLLPTRSPVRKRRRHIFSKRKRVRKKSEKHPAESPSSQVSILYVEDYPMVAKLISEVLEASDFRVELCADGDAALRKLTGDDHYDVLIIDNSLPGLSGLELVQRARKITHRRRTPIIMLSGDDIEKEAWRAGVDEFLRKPQDIDRVCSTVERLRAEGKDKID